MSTALQRLHARPSSLAFLRYLLREPALEHVLQSVSREPCIHTRYVRHRRYTTVVTNDSSKEFSTSEAAVDDTKEDKPHLLEQTDNYLPCEPMTPPEPPNDHPLPPILDPSGSSSPWGSYLRTFDEVRFQSDLQSRSDDGEKLINDPRFDKDLGLWTYLLEFRQRHYGDAGVAMFWAAVRERGLLLPTEGSMAHKLWPIFLQAGFHDKDMLHDICLYADELFESSGKRWPKLYVYIMQYIILNGERCTIMPWHERLIECHPPGPTVFSKFVRNVILMGGDLEALKLLYKAKFYETHDIYKTYGKIIPILLKQQDFHSAFQWHLFLVRRGDHPLNRKVVEPLIQHFEMYEPWKAMRIKNSLIATTETIAASATDGAQEPETISREMMNVVHGKAFGIAPKAYSDQLGARWFATNWISIDLAINTIHALGIQGIGPLSLQAIALREAGAPGIVRRIDQLRELGISLDGFVFSKAIEFFARNGETEYLNGLLRSDQHPDSYEDRQLQNNLLEAYARAEDWAQYRLTAAIKALGSHTPRVNRYNIMQQANISRGDRFTFFKMLEEMRVQRVPLVAKTIFQIRRHFLPHRRKGRGPNSKREYLDDLQTTISILKSIMEFGSFVPPTAWREIIRRLGMLRKFDDLEKLCFWLATCYNLESALHSQHVKPPPAVPAGQGHPLATRQIPASHRSHPLQLLFSNSLQRAIVEWAFIREPPRQLPLSKVVLDKSVDVENATHRSAYHYTRGVRLLRQLQDQGVYINVAQIRRALRNRFSILYNPGESRVLHNRVLKQHNISAQKDMVAQLNKAWGADIWRMHLIRSRKLGHASSK